MIHLPAYVFVSKDSVSHVDRYSGWPGSNPFANTRWSRHPFSFLGSSLTDSAFSAAACGETEISMPFHRHPTEVSMIWWDRPPEEEGNDPG